MNVKRSRSVALTTQLTIQNYDNSKRLVCDSILLMSPSSLSDIVGVRLGYCLTHKARTAGRPEEFIGGIQSSTWSGSLRDLEPTSFALEQLHLASCDIDWRVLQTLASKDCKLCELGENCDSQIF